LVTDAEAAPDFLRAVEQAGVNVLVAE